MKETSRHRRAFEQYVAMGPTRSLRQLARKLGVSATTVKAWSREFGWQARIAERDEAVAEVVQRESTRTEVDRQSGNRRLVEAAIITTAKQIAEGKVRASLSDLDRLLRLEQFLLGEADSRTELIERDLRGRSAQELREMVRTELQQLRDLVGEDAVFEAEEAGDGDLSEVDRS